MEYKMFDFFHLQHKLYILLMRIIILLHIHSSFDDI